MKKYILILLLGSLLGACGDKNTPIEIPAVPEDLTQYVRQDAGVMMQGFYWDVEPRHEWWKLIEGKIDNWKKIGIDRVWLPPVSKGLYGGNSMGYDPMDYFDFGNYDQMGTVKTRFGSKAELESFISKAHSSGLEVIADIVLNHCSGGELQFNPYRNTNEYTLFRPKSGRFNRTFEDFHPNGFHSHDAGAEFFPEQDLCHDQPNVKKWLWESDSSVAKYYKNTMKFDGWRFDYVKGYDPSVIKNWMGAVGGFGILEAWDGNTDYVNSWIGKTGISAFDFPLFYNLEQAIDGNNMRILGERNSISKSNPSKAVTIVNNHDLERLVNTGNRIDNLPGRLMAYAYILTHPGYPCIFYSDYESILDKTKLEKLIQINRSLAVGDLNVLYTDSDSYLALRSGDNGVPGLVVSLNNASRSTTKPAVTPWKNAVLYDYSGNTNETVTTDANGRAELTTPAKNYTIWSLKKF